MLAGCRDRIIRNQEQEQEQVRDPETEKGKGEGGQHEWGMSGPCGMLVFGKFRVLLVF